MGSPTTIVLAWSLPDEPAFIEHLRRECAPFVICALTLPALQAARRLTTREEWVDWAEVVPIEERACLFSEGERMETAFSAALSRQPGFGWFEPDLANSSSVFFTFLWCKALLAGLRKRFGQDARLRHYELFSRAVFPDGLTIDQFLGHLIGGLDGPHELAVTGWRVRMRAAMTRLGRVVARFPRLFLRRCPSPDLAPTPLLLAALTGGDSLPQQAISGRLARLGVEHCRISHGLAAFRTTADERALFEQAGAAGLKEIVLPRWPLRQWRSHIAFRCWNHCLRHAVTAAVEEAFAAHVTRRECDLIGVYLTLCDVGRLAEHVSACDLLDAVRPATLVVNSATFGMPMLTGEALRRGVHVVRLPHGVEPGRSARQWRASTIGCIGRNDAEQIARIPGLRTGTRVEAVGGCHVVEVVAGGRRSSSGEVPRSVLYLHSTLGINYGDADSEEASDACDLADALAAAGLGFDVRCHPRYGRTTEANFRSVRRTPDGVEHAINVLDARESLTVQLSRAGAAIIRSWSGVALAAMYAGIPLIGWMPRPHMPDLDRLLKGLPLHAGSAPELAALARRACEDAAFRASIIQAQDACLACHVEKPFGDPYEGAVRLVLKEHQAAARSR